MKNGFSNLYGDDNKITVTNISQNVKNEKTDLVICMVMTIKLLLQT